MSVPVQVTLPLFAYWIIGIAAVLAASSVIWKLAIKPVLNAAGKIQEIGPLIVNLHDELRTRDGVRVRDALETVHRELRPNGGSSLKDVVVKSAEEIQGINNRLDAGDKRFDRLEDQQIELLKRSNVRHVDTTVIENEKRGTLAP